MAIVPTKCSLALSKAGECVEGASWSSGADLSEKDIESGMVLRHSGEDLEIADDEFLSEIIPSQRVHSPDCAPVLERRISDCFCGYPRMCSRKRNHKHNSMGQLRFNPLKPPLVTHKSIRPALRTTVFFNRRKPKVVPAETIGGEPGPAEAATEETYRIPCRIMISGTSKQRGRSREMFYSMPMPSQLQHDTLNEHFRYLPKDDSYSLFRTRSTMRQQSKNNMELELQSGTPRTTEITENTIVSAGRYLDTLQGPDLDILKDESEGILLPLDEQWPFLLCFPIGCFGVSLGLGGQAILWKTLGVNLSMKFLHISLVINLTIWCLALISLISIFI
eukprot:c31013_g1_i1 orf=131-1132(+)